MASLQLRPLVSYPTPLSDILASTSVRDCLMQFLRTVTMARCSRMCNISIRQFNVASIHIDVEIVLDSTVELFQNPAF